MKKSEKPSSSLKLVISEGLQAKINRILLLCNATEWSGTLFYKCTGNIHTQDLVITAVDCYVEDIGSSTYTEFEHTTEFASYIVEKNLADCYRGLIHSHHSMGTFFSGTDTQTLREQAHNFNVFLSLIVNNSGEYSAKLATKKTTSGTIVQASYPNFNGETVKLAIEPSTKYEEVSILEFDLDIIYPHEPENHVLELLAKKARTRFSGYSAPDFSMDNSFAMNRPNYWTDSTTDVVTPEKAETKKLETLIDACMPDLLTEIANGSPSIAINNWAGELLLEAEIQNITGTEIIEYLQTRFKTNRDRLSQALRMRIIDQLETLDFELSE